VAKGTVGDVIGRAERNAVRVRVPAQQVEESERALLAVSIVRDVSTAGGMPGWLRVELNGSAETNGVNNQILGALIQADIPILSFEPQGGRLQDVFLDLTAGGAK
jgi:hypothetical protein